MTSPEEIRERAFEEPEINPGQRYSSTDVLVALARLSEKMNYLFQDIRDQKAHATSVMAKIEVLEARSYATPESVDAKLSTVHTSVNNRVSKLELWVFMMAGGLLLASVLLSTGVIHIGPPPESEKQEKVS